MTFRLQKKHQTTAQEINQTNIEGQSQDCPLFVLPFFTFEFLDLTEFLLIFHRFHAILLSTYPQRSALSSCGFIQYFTKQKEFRGEFFGQ